VVGFMTNQIRDCEVAGRQDRAADPLSRLLLRIS
jgi:hypothetical protein